MSPAPIRRGAAIAMTSLLASGAAGVALGGPLWGLLGTALLWFCVGWVCHLLQSDYLTDEIERYYLSPVAFPVRLRMTTRAAVLQRTRSFVLTPLGELESVPR